MTDEARLITQVGWCNQDPQLEDIRRWLVKLDPVLGMVVVVIGISTCRPGPGQYGGGDGPFRLAIVEENPTGLTGTSPWLDDTMKDDRCCLGSMIVPAGRMKYMNRGFQGCDVSYTNQYR